MQIDGARTLVVGATGVLGVALTRALRAEGARLVVTGRDQGRLRAVGGPAEAALPLDLLDVGACRAVVRQAAGTLGGLDLVVVATGVAAFGGAAETPDEVAEELFAVNTLGPIAVLSEAAPLVAKGGALVVLSAILADAPMAGMAAYSASKAGLTGYLTALRREVRRDGLAVLDVRPPHLETGLADRAIAGAKPAFPAGHDVEDLVANVLEGIRTGAKELVWDARARGLALR
jgi:NAD(P)-dependent dehydrogenase (short-subunit alcohol dehydrogenase family)